uniref:EGF-like domain-containing protein n=1 Tax=Panagrellus redivivus TaxID=6233 RepID=A0A7E4VR50_PANRE
MGKLLLLCLLGSAFIAVQSKDEFCLEEDAACKEQQRLSSRLSAAARENSRLQTELTKAVCSCKKFTCQNKGVCFARSANEAICQCPPNFKGPKCETEIKCNKDACGANTQCDIIDHEAVCRCLPGFTTADECGCTDKTYTAQIDGDPHYTTFDGVTFDYHGRCWTYLMRKCDINDKSFQIRGLNKQWGAQKESQIDMLQVEIRGTEYHFQNPKLVVNQSTRALPYNFDGVTVSGSVNEFILKDSKTLAEVLFRPANFLVRVTVPHSKFFVGENNFCGLFGNIDGKCENDFRYGNGTYEKVLSCAGRSDRDVRNVRAIDVGDSHIINRKQTCLSGSDLGYPTCDDVNEHNNCSLISDALAGKGPFAACKDIPNLKKILDHCNRDACLRIPKCVALSSFVANCLAQKTVKLDNWREAAGCEFKCGANSKYSLQTPTCQKSCARNGTVLDRCQNRYSEGCICNEGYLFDQNSKDSSCVAKEECGCMSKLGNFYPPKTIGLYSNCQKKYTCTGGTNLTIEDHSCGGGRCTVIAYHERCVCNEGFKLNGTTCVDTNQCARKPKLCGANLGRGKCQSVNVTHSCTCNEPWTGPDCTIFAPRRHCADIKKYRNSTETGVFTIFVGAEYTKDGKVLKPGTKLDVWCENKKSKGGWTLISGGPMPVNQSFNDYKKPFGNPKNKFAWFGLDNLHTITHSVPMSLRIGWRKCPAPGAKIKRLTYSLYNSFKVLDESTQYRVVIPINKGDEESDEDNTSYDGWTDWETPVGPKFSTFDKADNDKTRECVKFYQNTGWWYSNGCKFSNLNAPRPDCSNVIANENHGYVTWLSENILDAYMYVRPAKFPNYD